MDDTPAIPRKLEPMTAIEHAISHTFRNFFVALGLLLAWLIIIAPVAAGLFFGLLGGTMPDVKALPPAAIVAAGVLAVLALLALFSITVNWQRRVLLGERPRGLRWWRLDGPVWRFLFGLILFLIVVGIFAALVAAAQLAGLPALEAKAGAAAKPMVNVVSAIIGLMALFTAFKLSTWLAGIAAANRDYGFAACWRATAKNKWRFLGFTFWLTFTLAIAGAVGAGAVFAAKAMPENPWIMGAAAAVIALTAWFAIFFLLTAPASLYAQFAPAEAKES